jgi:xanthine/CO dehydrogenase XdhC/CoxF family maturation factor
MLEEFEQAGISLDSEVLNKIHSPVGLDIGAETPDEIALSIVSEIQSKFSKRSGGFLKYRQGPIHYRDQKSDQVFKQVYINPSSRNKAAK